MAYAVFGGLSGNIALSLLDSNFTQAAYAVDLTALTATVAALPASATPVVPTAAGTAGVAATLSRSDHAHPVQSASPTTNTTAQNVTSTNNGAVMEHNSASGVAYTFLNTISVGCSGLIVQISTGQVTMTAGAGTTLRQASSYTKTRTQWSVVSWYCRANPGGTAAEIVLSGDMSA